MPAGWGTSRLAANVKNDDGSAFKGSAWVNALFEKLEGTAARLKIVDSTPMAGQTPTTQRVLWQQVLPTLK